MSTKVDGQRWQSRGMPGLSDVVVSVGNDVHPAAKYAARLRYRAEDYAEQLASRLVHKTTAYRLVKCGRIVVRHRGSSRPYERSNYCRNRTRCLSCQMQTRARAARFRADESSQKSLRAVHIAFSPAIPSVDDYIKLAVSLADAIPRLKSRINYWNKAHRQSEDKVAQYALGLHLEANSNQPDVPWPHLHLVLQSPNRSISKPKGALVSRLAHAIEVELGEWPFKVSLEELGTVSNYSLSRDDRKRQHRGRTISSVALSRHILYAQTPCKPDASTVLRQRQRAVMAAIGDRPLKATSRLGVPAPRLHGPNQFPAHLKADAEVAVFPVSGGDPIAVTEAELVEAERQMELDFQQLVREAGSLLLGNCDE